jgi:hypothetical protein
MSVAPPPPVSRPQDQVTIVSHSNLFYWWPVWAVGFLLGILTVIDGHRMATVPAGTVAARNVEVPIVQGGGSVKPEAREILILPPGAHLRTEDPTNPNSPPQSPRLHVAKGKNYGVLFATLLILVILITNVPLRGMLSVVIIILAILLTVIFALAGWWEYIFQHLTLLDIRVNAGGYFFLSGILFVVWLVAFLFFDRQIYMIFTPGQFKVCTEIGGGEQVYDAVGMTLEKHRSDLFRHWILGLGSGDLTVKTSGAQAHHFEMLNVLFIGKKVQQIENMLKKRAVIEAR